MSIESIATDDPALVSAICGISLTNSSQLSDDGPFCPAVFDGWACWNYTQAETTAYIACPPFPAFNTKHLAHKFCYPNGTWYLTSDYKPLGFGNYTGCHAELPELGPLEYLMLAGSGISLVSAIIAIVIFAYFKALHCQRNTIHMHLLITFAMSRIAFIIPFLGWNMEGVTCKIIMVLNEYCQCANYFWMLCEGVYLHTLIVVAVFTEQKNLRWFYVLGYGVPTLPTLLYVILTLTIGDSIDDVGSQICMTGDKLLYVTKVPIVIALLLNAVFLLNIVRVLVTKLRASQSVEQNQYRKAVRATLILIPLFGLWVFLMFVEPKGNKTATYIYKYTNGFLQSFQGFFVASIYCFFNGEVKTQFKRKWEQRQLHRGNIDRKGSRSFSLYTTTDVSNIFPLKQFTSSYL